MNSINRTAKVFIVFSLAVSGMVLWLGGSSGFRHIPPLQQTASEASMSMNARLQESYGKLPLSFEPNMGQTDSQVKFLSRGNGYSLFLTPTEAVLALNKGKAKHPADSSRVDTDRIASLKQTEQTVIRMAMPGSNRSAKFVGVEELPGKSNYFIGSDPKKWRTNVPNYRSVKLENVYPGIDLVYYGEQLRLEYDLIVSPGADPNQIKLAFEGANDIKIDPEGNLILQTKSGDLYMHKPKVYQETGGARRLIEASYVLRTFTNGQSKNKEKTAGIEVSFEVAAYERTQPLVIDPVLSYSTYLGGSGNDLVSGIAVDSSGNAYVTGSTTSSNFPTANALQPANAGFNDVFVTKINAEGSALLYSTYLGGSSNDWSSGIAVDGLGNAYITGTTNPSSSDFPTTPGSFQTMLNGSMSAFVTKINAAGSALVYSTFLGGSNYNTGNTSGSGIAVDGSGNAYVTGTTYSIDFPTVTGGQDAFVAKLNPVGSALVYSTYLGGSGGDDPYGIAVDGLGDVYVTGNTTSINFPTANALQPGYAPGSPNAFVAKINPTGTAFVYSTYLGSYSYGRGIAADGSGNAYVTGSTGSLNFPTANALQPAKAGGVGTSDAFVTKINPAGSALVYSTYLGGTDHDYAYGIAVDGSGNVYVTGGTGSANFPLANAIQGIYRGAFDAFVTELNASGSALVFSTYQGGTGTDDAFGIALDGSRNIYLAGNTGSMNFPTANPLQPANAGGGDAFVAKINPAGPPPTVAVSLTPVNISTAPSVAQSLIAVYTDSNGYQNISTASLSISGISRSERVNYSQATNEFSLMGVGGTCFPGQAATLSDGYLTFNCGASSISGSGDTLTVTYNLIPQPSLSGTPYLLTISVMDQDGANNSKTPGTWIINRRPNVDSVSPMNSMGEAGMGQRFDAVYSDPDGYQNIAAANLYFSGNGGMHNEWLHYLVAPNLFTMMGTNDVCSPGQMKMLTNGYLNLDCSSSIISGSGNRLTVVFWVTPQMPSSGIMYDMFAAASDQADASYAIYAGTWMIQ